LSVSGDLSSARSLGAGSFDLAEEPLQTRQVLLIVAAQVMYQASKRKRSVGLTAPYPEFGHLALSPLE
jgi:hypothetical protein